MEIPVETVYSAIEFGHRNGIKTLLNPAPAVGALDLEKIRHATFLAPNESELRTLSGQPVDSLAEVEAAARSLIAKGIGTVIVTLGARGALLVTETDVVPIASPGPVTPVDTTGAGDAFMGCFARYYVETGDLLGSLGKAVRYAADSITRRGAQKAYAFEDEFKNLGLNGLRGGRCGADGERQLS